ncbi:MAG: hypothetical protein KGI60_02050 [Patescibacteria group bacterium]|nr:hypothetical protein [Patescibacteria group bacterium]
MREKYRFYVELADDFIGILPPEEFKELDALIRIAQEKGEALLDFNRRLRLRTLSAQVSAQLIAIAGSRGAYLLAYDDVIANHAAWKDCAELPGLLAHTSQAKIVFYALDALLMDIYNSGVWIMLGNQEKYGNYLALYTSLFPGSVTLDVEHLDRVNAHITMDAFESFHNHLPDCAGCSVGVEHWKDAWADSMKDHFS